MGPTAQPSKAPPLSAESCSLTSTSASSFASLASPRSLETQGNWWAGVGVVPRSQACSLCVTHKSYSSRSRISLIPSDTAGPSASRRLFMPPTSSYQGSRSVLNRSHRIYKYNGMSTRPECYAERMEWTKSQAFPLLDGPVNTTKQASSCLVVQVEHPAQISASTSRPRDSLVQCGGSVWPPLN